MSDRTRSVRDALLRVLEADNYPCLGNGDVAIAMRLEAEAIQRLMTARPSPDDPPEFAVWVAVLRTSKGRNRDAVFSAMYDYLEPDEGD